MVKNSTGGKKSKAFARKENIRRQTALRTADENGEVYAQAVKVMGGSIASVIDIHGKPMRANIRGKFRGRNKRGNFIAPGVWLLVGLHEWEEGKNRKEGELINCDILEVYTDADKNRLKMNETHIDWSKFVANDANLFNEVKTESTDPNEGNTLFEFADEATHEYETLMRAQKASLSTSKASAAEEYSNIMGDEEINVDDI